MKIARFFAVLLVTLLLSSVAVAQGAVQNEEFGVSVTPPSAWEVNADDDKAVANFKHAETSSQIQVIGTKLMSQDVADVFFSTFHKTLTESSFEQQSSAASTIGEREGKLSSYAYTHSGQTVNVLVFEFLREGTAWLVIGYMQDSEAQNLRGDFDTVVSSMSFEAAE
ncbi:hypothetical protein DV096_08130 [Bradymonadaceae bacterium TMQ3]|uniref:DUF1795 domain-containing protein n=1 Tax=Lujinxingia sediminis TaxID=2480984 RepID=A0ABY0CSC4_9DELT|nr:hypothetical protein [Lujinxingia sediminis]RDV38763.1 hypothetical protein DV096_08130 [Bradymonadaceae bacterium TMQ3]RVU43999.1 hypothetical protein EA187_10565 [Lujinxingia sediminis]TXC76464.1 hypothetical protein FRC91_06945 [Bradymonadales bacterium TMQ1]